MSVAHVLPALLFGALGVLSAVQVIGLCIQWRRDGLIRTGGFGWAPFGGWQPLASLIGDALRTPEERKARLKETRNRWAISGWILVYAAIGVGSFAGAYEYLRFGHGFGN